MFCLRACLCATCVAGACGGLKRTLDPWNWRHRWTLRTELVLQKSGKCSQVPHRLSSATPLNFFKPGNTGTIRSVPHVDNRAYIHSHLDSPPFLFPLTSIHFYKMRSKKLRQGDSDCVVLCSSVPLFWIADTFLGSLCVPCLCLYLS